MSIHLPFSHPILNGPCANAYQRKQCQEREDRHRQPDAPIDLKQQQQYTNHQNDIPQQVDDELREEIGENIHISIDTFDQLPGGMFFVVCHIERETMRNEISA